MDMKLLTRNHPPQSGFVAYMFLPADPGSVSVSFPASCVSWLMMNFDSGVVMSDCQPAAPLHVFIFIFSCALGLFVEKYNLDKCFGTFPSLYHVIQITFVLAVLIKVL